VMIFAGGFGLGAWLESRHTTQVVLDMHQRDTAEAAAMVQRTGSAYVSALVRSSSRWPTRRGRRRWDRRARPR
jgi:hypothetical protein